MGKAVAASLAPLATSLVETASIEKQSIRNRMI